MATGDHPKHSLQAEKVFKRSPSDDHQCKKLATGTPKGSTTSMEFQTSVEGLHDRHAFPIDCYGGRRTANDNQAAYQSKHQDEVVREYVQVKLALFNAAKERENQSRKIITRNSAPPAT